eukprot:GHVT01063448.1.p1 GENE.GHVT01063448.1~~GHVT01063448.1.p1  ORF type:complete len:167 (+),score=15.34 GHVT01063448.1:1145-1645(+)
MSRQANRSGELKNTVTLQRRPGRTSTMQSRLTSSQIQSLQRQESVEPNDIPKRLATVYVPDGFDQGSGLLVCNFPAGSSAADCRNFFSWYGPVIYVEYAPTVAGESNFVVVFAAPDFTTTVPREMLDRDGTTTLVTRRVNARPTLSKTIVGYFEQLMGTANRTPAW